MINLEELLNNEEFQWAYEDWCLRKTQEALDEYNENKPKLSQVEYLRRVIGINVSDDWKRKPKYTEDEKKMFAYLKRKYKKEQENVI